MFVIIKNLHQNTTIDDLEKFVAPAISGRFFQRKGSIKALKIIELTTRKGSSVERHGIVRVDSDSTKKRLVKFLNNRSINKVSYAVDEYVIRHWSADHRSNGLSVSSLAKKQIPDRRKSDRRRSSLRMVEVCQKAFSMPTVQVTISRAI